MSNEVTMDIEAGPAPVVVDHPSGSQRPHEVEEPYLTLEELAVLHVNSNIDVKNPGVSKGLTSEEAAKRLEKYGRNVLSPPPRIPEWLRLLNQFKSLFLIILLVSAAFAILSFGLFGDATNLYLGLVLFVVVFLTGFLGFHEEGKAIKVMDSFSTLLPAKTLVLRDGKQQEMEAALLVPGDLVLIRNGDRVPADSLLLSCSNLKTDCSMLTGESEPVQHTDGPCPAGTELLECTNMAFNGTLCFDGAAVALVLHTGDRTAIGTMAKLVSESKERESTLQREVRNFVKLVAAIAITMATVSFIVSAVLQKASTVEDIVKIFINGFLVLVMANIPQGLPSTVVSMLSLAARNMAKRSVLVKRIDCVETLGSCSIICSDKTGTLTMNKMTVTDIWYDGRLMRMYRKESHSVHTQEPQALLYRCAIICNRAEPLPDRIVSAREVNIHEHQIRQLSNVSRLSWAESIPKNILSSGTSGKDLGESAAPAFAGNPSDVALLNHFDKTYSVTSLRAQYPVLFEVPFNSTNKWQLVIVKSVETGNDNSDGQVQYEVLMKGAPEVILTRCKTYATRKDGVEAAPVTDAFRELFQKTYEGFASQGRRVLAFCSATFRAPDDMEFAGDDDGGYNFPTSDMNFIGMTAIMDPPRDNVPDSIKQCHSAGVKVFMVTGDHPWTARSIARQIGLLSSDNNIELLGDNHTVPQDESKWDQCDGAVVHGCRVDGLTDDQWHVLLSRPGGICFARTTPVHKRLIVEKCQTLKGAIVAVTGDGVNDAPALKQADIGIAMGLNGSAVAQDAADILLMDDNFASIVAGIEEGRIIFDNIKKTIAYIMAHIFPEAVSALIALLIGLPAGLTAMQVLTIDLGTEMFVSISLAYEKPESDIMKRPPRDLFKDRLVSPVLLFYAYVTAGCILSAGCMGAYAITYWRHDIHLSDFFRPGLDESGGDFFTLTASDSVTIDRTGKTYTASEQKKIFSEGVTAFYIALTVGQFCHIWACKTRATSLFKHGFDNKLTFYGVGVGLLLVLFFSYVPGVQTILGSAIVGWVPWVFAVATGAVLLLYNEAAKWYIRNAKPEDPIAKLLAW